MMNAAFIIFLWEARCMGVFDVISMIGTSYVLISLYCAFSHIERRYHTVWHSAKKHRQNRTRMPYKKLSKNCGFGLQDRAVARFCYKTAKRTGRLFAALSVDLGIFAESALVASNLHHEPYSEDKTVAETFVANQFVQFIVDADELQQALLRLVIEHFLEPCFILFERVQQDGRAGILWIVAFAQVQFVVVEP